MPKQAIALLFGALSLAGSGQTPSAQPPVDLGTPTIQWGSGYEHLKPTSTVPITMHMTVPADRAYQILCKLAGINVVFAPDYQAPKITLAMTDVSLRDALDTISLLSHTYWRAVLPNTVFVTPSKPQLPQRPETGAALCWDQKTVCL